MLQHNMLNTSLHNHKKIKIGKAYTHLQRYMVVALFKLLTKIAAKANEQDELEKRISLYYNGEHNCRDHWKCHGTQLTPTE